MSLWTTKRAIFGLLLFGTLAACVFAQVWGFMTAISSPTFLEPVRAEHPRTIVWWIRVLYLGSVILTLVPAAAFWLVVGADRRTFSALLAVVPLLALLLADFTYAALTFDFPLQIHRLLGTEQQW